MFDYDRDGKQDILVSTHNVSPWRLRRKQGNGTFAEILTGTFCTTDRHGCVPGSRQLGGHGRPDGRGGRLLPCPPGCARHGATPNTHSMFIEGLTAPWSMSRRPGGVADPHGRGREAVALDYDRDGLLDLAGGERGPLHLPSEAAAGTAAAAVSVATVVRH